jgi:voltage-gated potassium channel
MLNVLRRHVRLRRRDWFSEQTDLTVKRRLRRLIVLLLCVAAAHSGLMVVFEGLPFQQALWLTMTTVTTVGYGDLSPQTLAGQISTILLLYLVGIALLAQVVGEYIDYRIETRERMARGQWRWKKMKDHILILNTPSTDRVTYLERLIQQIRNTPGLCELPVQLLTTSFPDGLPESLKILGVVHHTALPESSGALRNVNLDKAAYVLVLAEDAHDRRSDSCTLDILDHIKRAHVGAYVVAECVHDNNKSRFIHVRADAVLRPVRAYPELLVRALAAPGTEQILENLFTYQGVHPHRFDVSISGLNWGQVVAKLLDAGVGTPLGYVQQDNQVVANPGVSEQVEGKAVIVMVNQAYKPDEQIVNEALSC